MDTASKPSLSARASATAAIFWRLSRDSDLDIRTVYHYSFSYVVRNSSLLMGETAVLVVGAGPTGLTLAIDLARRGVAFRLIDAASTPFTGARGKGIQPRTLEIFDDLGVIDAILAAGQLYPRFRLHFGPFSLRVGSLAPFRPQTQGVPYPNTWMIPQWRTEAILRERLHELGGEVEFGRGLATFMQNEHSVEATLTNGDVVRSEFLVGADGGHSTVRKALGLRLEGEAVDKEKHLVADLEVAGMDRRDWHVWPFAKGGIVSLCPLPNTSLCQFVANWVSPSLPRCPGVARTRWLDDGVVGRGSNGEGLLGEAMKEQPAGL